MRQVLDAVRRPMIRSAVVALSLSGLMVFGGTALARLPGGHAPRTVHPAAATAVQVLASKTVKQHATAAGAVASLTSVGGISSRVVCTNTGSGIFKTELQFKSSPAGAVIMSTNGSVKLTASYVGIYNVTNSVAYGYGTGFDVMTSSSFQHYEAAFNEHQLGNDCVTHIAVMNN